MKTRYFWIVLGLCSLMMAIPSCNFLDLHDPDAMDETKFYRDSADIEGLLSSAYSALRPAYDKLFFVTEMKSDNSTTTDNGTAGGLYFNFVNHTVTSSNSIVADIYNAFYFCIHRANLVLEHVDAISMPEEERARLRGEALFLRALSHFYLTRLWGPVVIMRNTVSGREDALSKRRSPRSEVYAFVIEDLKEVADNDMLPANCRGDQFGHASLTAACALLGRVYLQQAATQELPERYNDAITYLEKALTVSGYRGLTTPYNKLFTLEHQTDEEIIFPIMYKPNSAECSNFAEYFQPQGVKDQTSALPGRGFNVGQVNLYNEFEHAKAGYSQEDGPRGISMYRNIAGTYTTFKYVDLRSSGYGGNLWFELRFADVYLMLAEAYERVEGNASTKAIAYLNMVRQRPTVWDELWLMPSYEKSMENETYRTNYPTLRDAIFHERRVELCFENQRWFDLQRLYPNEDDFVAYMRSVNEPNVGGKYTNFQAYELLLPIPYDEVFLNPGLGQNEGY